MSIVSIVSIGFTIPEKMIFKAKKPANCQLKKKKKNGYPNNENVMGQGQVSNQSRTSWYPVITASGYKVAVRVLSLINDVTHKIHHTK